MELLVGLGLGGFGLLCMWFGYDLGYDNGRADAALDLLADR
jgi:hypothetical protein